MTFCFYLRNLGLFCHYGLTQWDQVLCILETNKYVFKSGYKFQFLFCLISFGGSFSKWWWHQGYLGQHFFKKGQGILCFSEHIYYISDSCENTISSFHSKIFSPILFRGWWIIKNYKRKAGSYKRKYGGYSQSSLQCVLEALDEGCDAGK